MLLLICQNLKANEFNNNFIGCKDKKYFKLLTNSFKNKTSVLNENEISSFYRDLGSFLDEIYDGFESVTEKIEELSDKNNIRYSKPYIPSIYDIRSKLSETQKSLVKNINNIENISNML